MVLILLSSNEGWGLALTESLLTGTPFIANVTGGMQDQMRFIDSKGNWFTPCSDIPSNHRGTYKEHGEWAYPVYPTSFFLCKDLLKLLISLMIDVVGKMQLSRLKKLYETSPEERKERGLAGMEWALGDEAGFTSEKMSKRMIKYIDKLFDTWKPIPKYQFLKDTDFEKRVLPHKLIY